MGVEKIWLLWFVLAYWAFCGFWAIRGLRRAHTADDFFLAGRNLSAWVFALGATGSALAAWAFMAHPGLVFRDGFQFLNTGYFGVVAALAAVILLKRQWQLARHFGYGSAGEMLMGYFASDSLRLASVAIALLFGVPFVGMLFGAAGFVASELSGGWVSRDVAMWVLGSVVLFYCVSGGLQAVVKIAVVQTVLFFLSMFILGGIALNSLGGFEALNNSLATMAQNVTGYWQTTQGFGGGDHPAYFALPGVIQWNAGLGTQAAVGGPWTAIMCLTFLMSVMGIHASPNFTLLGLACRSPRGFAIHSVWGAAALVGFLMIVVSAVLGVGANFLGANAEMNAIGMASQQLLPEIGREHHNELMLRYIQMAATLAPWLLGFLAVCAIAALQAGAATYLSTTGSIVCRDFYLPYINSSADDQLQKTMGRLFTGLAFLAAMLLATFAANVTVLLASLAMAVAFQLWPTLLAMICVPWISARAALLGLLAGVLAVVLTEPLGQLLTGGSLPWGRWPWTIHSAAWGMFFNVLVCLIVSVLTREDADRERRNEFHRVIQQQNATSIPGKRIRAVAGLFALIWIFFAIGPGAVLGNFFFGAPTAGFQDWHMRMPSLWAWQVIWWLIGVGLIWFLANKMEMATESVPNVVEHSAEAGLEQD